MANVFFLWRVHGKFQSGSLEALPEQIIPRVELSPFKDYVSIGFNTSFKLQNLNDTSEVRFHVSLATPIGIFEYFCSPQHALCHVLAFLYANGRFRTLRVVTHTPGVAAWRALHETHFLVQAMRHKTKLPVTQRNFGCPMLRWSGDIRFTHLE